MSCVRSLLLVSFVCALLPADTVILQGGKAWYLADGATIAVPVDSLIRLGGPIPPTDPTDPTDPPTDPPNEGELEQLSSAWRVKVDPYPKRDHHRQGLHAMYSVLASQADAGEFSDLDELKERESEVASLLLGSDELKWNEWYAPIRVYLGANVSSVADAAVAFPEISAGLEVVGEAIGPVWAIVIKLIIQMLAGGDIDPKMLALIMLLLDALAGGST